MCLDQTHDFGECSGDVCEISVFGAAQTVAFIGRLLCAVTRSLTQSVANVAVHRDRYCAANYCPLSGYSGDFRYEALQTCANAVNDDTLADYDARKRTALAAAVSGMRAQSTGTLFAKSTAVQNKFCLPRASCHITFTFCGTKKRNRKDVAMTTMASARRSSFGMSCAHCDNELIAPEWTEHRKERHIRHVWHCWHCDCRFETIVDTKMMENPTTRDDFSPSRLVA